MSFMANKEKKIKLKRLLEELFSKNDGISFYFLKASKVQPELQFQIPFKTKKKNTAEKIKTAQKKLQEATGSPWEFTQWSKFIGKIVPESKVYKIPFFKSEDIEINNPWRVCPIGEHWVKRHPKSLRGGKKTDHDGHCRKNPSGKDLLKGDEMDLIATSDLFLNPRIKVSEKDLKLPQVSIEAQNKYDDLISGWTAYWNDVFKLEDPLHPNYVKALIATESTFNPLARAYNPPPTGPARGLMQLTEKTTRLAQNFMIREYRDHYIFLDLEDLWEPNKNISFGVRHIFRKREIAKSLLKREPTWLEVLMDYKGRLNSRTKKTERVRGDLSEILKKMNTK